MSGAATLAFAADGALRMLVQLYLRDLAAPPLLISMNTSLVWGGMFAGSYLWGLLGDRFSQKGLLVGIMVAVAATVGALAALLPPAATLGAVLGRATTVTGIVPIAMAMVSAHSRPDQRGRRLSHISAARAAGLAAGTALGGALLSALGFPATFALLALLPALGTGLLVRLPAAGGRRRPQGGRSPFRCLADRGLRALYLGATLRQMGTTGSLSLIYVYMAELDIASGSMGGIGALGPATAILGMFLFGRLADRIGRKRVFAFGFGLSCLVPVCFALSQGAAGVATGFVVLGLSFGSLYMGSTALIGDVIPQERQGEMLGLFETSRGLGGVLGPVLAGLLMPALGFRGMFLGMAGLAGVGFTAVAARTREPSGRTPPPC
ncbi:MAG: MFS transporter [Candidatus Bipolaricaulaceae bacterium]